MEQVLPKIHEIAGKISGAEMKRKSLARFLRAAESDLKISKISYPVGKADLDGMKIAGVDGGIVKRSLHGFDVILARAAGVCFSYHGGKVDGVEYHPSRNPAPELFVLESLSELDWVHSASIIRQKLEIRNAIETAGKFRPGLLLLDGSLVPHYSDRPGKSSKVRESYDELISLYNGLFGACSKNGIMLAGVVEDSRGTRFCEITGEKILSASSDEAGEMGKILGRTRDTALLYWLLEEGERTFAFPYSDVGEEHPLAREFGSFGSRIFSFYLKSAKFDRPARVDFLCEGSECENEAGRLARAILSISSHHSGYGFPSVLIEADQAAKLAEEDIEGVYDQILARTGPLPGVAKLRRDERPF